MTHTAFETLRFFKTSERTPLEQKELLCYTTQTSGFSSVTIAYIGMLLDGVWCRDGIDEWIPCERPHSWAYIPENPWS